MIYERARFNTRRQQVGESVEQYILALYSLIQDCDYSQEQVIRDRLVIGIRDAQLSKRMQMDPELTLEKAKKLVRQAEAVNEENQTLTGEKGESKSNPIQIDVVQKRKQPRYTRRSNAAAGTKSQRIALVADEDLTPERSVPSGVSRAGRSLSYV